MTAAVAALVAVAVAVAGGILLLRLRRAGLALHRQLDVIGDEIGAERNDRNLWAARLQEATADLRDRAQTTSMQTASIQDLQRDTADRIVQIQSDVNTLSASVSGLAAPVAAAAAAAEAVEIIARRPLHTLPIEPRLVEATSQEELIALAESMAILRPLAPYPKWRTDAEAHNPDFAFQLRRWFWQYFHDRQREAPLVVPWHAGTRLRLFLGNDLSSQIYIAGCFEPNEFAFLDRILRPGMTFLDAGANEGIYTIFAARRLGREGTVWAFEPSRREVERLHYNVGLNELASRIFPLALADFNGQAELTVGGYEHPGLNTLGAFANQAVEMERKELVEVRRLDDVISDSPPPRIDVMKLDVEGAELRLLRGAVSTLECYRPVVLFEVSESSLRLQDSSSEELVGFLRARKYLIHTFDRSTGLAVPAAPGVFSDNMIGVPEEKPLPDAVRWPWPVPARIKKMNSATNSP
jgi:FkbM family methyltransferase